MKSISAAILCLLSLPSVARAQQTPAPPSLPSSTAPANSQSGKEAPDYSQEPFVIEQYYTTARYENDGTGERTLAVHIRVQSDAAVQQLGQLVFGYSSANEQMDVHYVRVRKADGTVVNADADAIKDMTGSVARDAPVYTDYKEKHITVPALAPGETIEYEIVTRLVTPLAAGEFWMQHNFVTAAIALDERLEINVPEHRKINLESPKFPYEMATENGRVIYRWKRSNLKRPDDSEKDKSAQKPDEKVADVQLTTFTNWESVARWYAKLEEGRSDPTPEIRAKVAALTQGRTTDLEKMQALYDYVSKYIRYVSLSFGLGRYQPHSAGEIFSNQYGDCKDKQTLLAAMLQAAGIPSDAVLISYVGKMDESMPSPSQFDHVITAVPHDSELIWMDSTAEVAPFRLLSSPLRKKSALLIPADGKGKVVETPADPPFVSTQQVEITGQVSDLGKLTAHLHYAMRGDAELVLRLAFRRTPQTQWKELGQTVLRLDGLSGDVVSVKPSDPTDTQNPFELDLDFTQTDFLDWSSKKSKAALPLLAIGLPNPPEDATKPIDLGSPLDVSVKLKLDLPASFTAQAPIAVSVSRDYAEFKSSYDFSGHTLTAQRSMSFKMRELPASRAGDYAAFSRAVNSDAAQALVVENATPGAPTIPDSAKEGDLFEAAAAALNSGNSGAAIPLFQRVVALNPQHKEAWNDLGLAYLREGKNDEAAASFRKQLEVNAFDEHANDYLGVALEEQQKFPEAIAAFRKQLDGNPLDLMAHAALGGIYLEQHEYAQAVPELEKATILSPDNAELQVSLGRAYLNTNEKDKALAAFEKGADLSQTPVVWNDIAYNLADSHIDLDKAQEYAESAVSSTAAALRNITLKNVTLESLAQVVSIGAFWDTLGWVHFRKGDLAQAERYISAAWKLDQHGEVGDHLAQVYEKLGQKDRAEQTYAEALVAPHSVPETRARLMLLLGGNSGMDDLLKKAQPGLVSMRSFPLKGLKKVDASADFLLVFSPGGADGNGVKVESVKFARGEEALRSLADSLSALDYGAMFPDASPIKLVRRGTLTCSANSGDCTFILALPENVHSIN